MPVAHGVPSTRNPHQHPTHHLPTAVIAAAGAGAAIAGGGLWSPAGAAGAARVEGAGQPVSIVIVPGWRNSGPGHWQSCWADRIPGAIRVQQQDWQQPRREPWVAAVAHSIAQAPHPVIIAAHSLGCIASVHAAMQLHAASPEPSGAPPAPGRIAGALLVAPADPERRALFEDFTPVPADPLPFPSIVVASSNDPFCPIRMASAYAKSWGSTFVRMPDAGHINTESGHGEWPLGWALLGALAAHVAQPAA